MRHKSKIILVLAAALGLSACVNSDLERGAIGAGAGALIAGATGNNVAAGAVIGGAGGVLCDDVNLC